MAYWNIRIFLHQLWVQNKFRLTIIKFKVLDAINEYENTTFDRDLCTFIGYRLSNDEFSTTAGNRKPVSLPSQIEVPLNFTLKAKGGEKAKEGQENKSITVDVTVQQGEGGSPTKIPVTAMVPNNTKMQDVQLCSSMKEGKESCQTLKDLMPKAESQSSSGPSKESKSSSSNSTDKNNE